MRAGDDKIVPAAQEKLLQDFRQRGVVKLPVQNRFHFGVAADHGVSDDDDLGVGRNIFGAIPLMKRDPLALEKGRHRRINIFVRAGDGEAALAQRRGDRSHRGAADAKEMKISGSADHANSLRRE